MVEKVLSCDDSKYDLLIDIILGEYSYVCKKVLNGCYTNAQLAELLDVPIRRLCNWRRKNKLKIKYVKKGRRIHYYSEDVRTYLMDRYINAYYFWV